MANQHKGRNSSVGVNQKPEKLTVGDNAKTDDHPAEEDNGISLSYAYYSSGETKGGLLFANPMFPVVRGEFLSDYLGFFGFGYNTGEVPTVLRDLAYIKIPVHNNSAAFAKLFELFSRLPDEYGVLVEEQDYKRPFRYLFNLLSMDNTMYLGARPPTLPISAVRGDLRCRPVVLCGVDKAAETFMYVGVENSIASIADFRTAFHTVPVEELPLNFEGSIPTNTLDHTRQTLWTMGRQKFMAMPISEQDAFLKRFVDNISRMSTYLT